MLRIEYDDLCSRYICKTSQCCFSCISGCRSKNYNIIADMILSGSGCHQMRQDGKCHILECNSCTMEKLKEICSVCFMKRCNLFCVKLFIICVCNTVLQFIFCKVCKKTAHNFVCCFLICHLSKFFYRHIQFRDLSRDKQSSIFGKSF